MTRSDFHEYSFSNASSYFYRDKVGAIILCGGEGKRLAPLTCWRCKPTVSFGGRYKLIDIPISHAIDSGLSKIFVIGQYLTYTLQQHLFKSCSHHNILNQIHLLAPEVREDQCQVWYRGTADAIRQNLLYLEDTDIEYFLILSGDQLYNMDFQAVIDYTVQSQADMTIVAQPIREIDAKRMGVLRMDEENCLIDFYEKPQTEDLLARFRLSDDDKKQRHIEASGDFFGSMGIYVFRREALFHLLLGEQGDDFGKHLIHAQMKKGRVNVFVYDGYWTDIGTIRSYFEANIALTRNPYTSRASGLNCYHDRGMIYSKNHHLPGAMVANSMITNSLLCEGVVVDSSQLIDSVIGIRGVVGKNSTINRSILMGNDRYGSAKNSLGVGEDCEIEQTIIDENCSIGKGVKLLNKNKYQNYDSPDGMLVVRDGITVIPRGTRIPDYYVF